MERLSTRLRVAYGAHPLHLLAVMVALAVGAYVLWQLGLGELWDEDVWWQSILVWFLGAVVVHDLVLFPLYALVDRGLVVAVRRGAERPAVSLLNHVRVPALASGLLFLLFFPGIIQQGASSYQAATGQTQDPFLERWLVLTVAAFLLSALVYAVRLRRARTRAQ